jgi:predicted permease
MNTLLQDIRYALRQLRKSPGFTLTAVLTLALGVGANTTIFSMVSRFILRPAPMGDPKTLLSVSTTHDGDQCCNIFAFPVYNDIRDQAKSFSGVAAYYALMPASIGGGGEPERVWGQGVTSNFFEVTELPMVLGRGFISGQEDASEVVLGAGLWQRRFNADRGIIGKPVILSGRTFTVVGVVTPAFHSVDQLLGTEFWVPLGNTRQLAVNAPPQDSRDAHWLTVVRRLRPGVTRAQAAAELNTLAERFALSNPKTDQGNRFSIDQAGSLPPSQRTGVVIFLAALSVVVLLVLAIAGTNVTNLLFVRAATRERDMAIRLALGASRGQLLRQRLIESVLLGLGGGVLGVVLSLWATRSLSALHLPAPVPIDVRIDVDWRVLFFAFALSVISGLMLGLVPAWTASRPQQINALKGEDALARPGRRISLRNLLVVAQIAMSVVLLCITGLFLRSLQSAASIDIGFRPEHLLTMSVDPRVHGYTPERTIAFLTQMQQRVAALPGVVSVTSTDVVPLSGGDRSDSFHAEGGSDQGKSDTNAELFMVAPGYFETMGIPRISGGDFGGEVATGQKVAIVNRAFVERVFGGANPIGRRVVGGGTTYEIIGVTGNVKSRTLGEEVRPVLYRSLVQSIAGDPSLMGYSLVVRTAGNPATLTEAVRQQIHALDPTMAIFNEETMEEHVRTAFFLPRLAATLFGTFGCIGLVLAAVGLYGVMSYTVSRRTREIGIRMALGAQPGSVERLILRQGLVLSLISIALGWPAAWLISKLASSFLYGIQPHDAFTFALVPPLLAAIALAACWVPAHRAASIEPMQALRAE